MKWNFDELEDFIEDKVDCVPYEFEFGCYQCDPNSCMGIRNHTWYVQAKLWRPDRNTGHMGYGFGGKRAIEQEFSADAVVKMCLVACFAYAEHEIREAFRYNEERVFDPHASLEDLWLLARNTNLVQGRS